MDQLCFHDVMWDSNVFTRDLPNACKTSVSINVQFSDSPSRPSKSLVSMDLYNQVESIKTGKKIDAAFENAVRIHKFLNDAGNTGSYYEYFELFRYLDLEDVSSGISLGKKDAAMQAMYSLFPGACTEEGLDEADLVTLDPEGTLTSAELVKQIISAVRLCSPGSTLIIKLCDMYTRPVCQLMYITSKAFEKLKIVKPRSSMYTRPDRYAVFSGFNGDSSALNVIDKLSAVSWGSYKWCKTLGVDVPSAFENNVRKFNDNILAVQKIYLSRNGTNKFQAENTENFLNIFELKKYSETKCAHPKLKSVGKFDFCVECFQLFI